ncbi:MAG: (Fe-S)-binding protein, partial [Rhodospirillaceae bacterium]|nr:(Fe-S)-binding protein [Rhodospirillaceae bacterium]
MTETGPNVGLLATCLVDSWRPSVGFAAVKLLEEAGCRVSVPAAQTCCGQPAYNGGDRSDAQALARRVIEQFEDFDYVVVPSGSCAGMVSCHYPKLFEDDPAMARRAQALARKTWELVSFLTDICGIKKTSSAFQGTVTYHDGCAGLRELGIRDQPRALLSSLPGVTLMEHGAADVCCGFGGTFCVKYPDISLAMTDAKIDSVRKSGARTVVAGDLGCLLAMAGRLSRRELDIEARHVAE